MASEPKAILLHEIRLPCGELTTFTVGIGYAGDLVFNEGTFYPPLDEFNESREVDEYLTVNRKHFDQLRTTLGLASNTSLAELIRAIADAAKHRQVHNLGAAKKLLTRFKVPWETSGPWFTR
jgi:hypothetical protein